MSFDELAALAEAPASAAAARALVDRALPRSVEAAAHRVKATLARRGLRDDARAFTLPDVLARGGGNCLGLSLFVAAALREAGHEVRVAIRIDPYDDVRDASVEYLEQLRDPDDGIDDDSRLPDAADRSAQYRCVAVEHVSLVLRDDTPFEATGLHDPASDAVWAPAAASTRVVEFGEAATLVLSERAKVARAAGELRAAFALARRAVTAWPGNREAWAELWRIAIAAGRPQLAARIASRYATFDDDDALFWFTRYQMTGDRACLERTLERMPCHAPAYAALHGSARRELAIAAWLYAGCEILDLAQFYAEHGAAIAEQFGRDELDTIAATFG